MLVRQLEAAINNNNFNTVYRIAKEPVLSTKSFDGPTKTLTLGYSSIIISSLRGGRNTLPWLKFFHCYIGVLP